MRAELKRLHNEFKTTIVFVTHDQWEAMTLATTIAVMSEGRLQQVGTPNDIYDRPANRFVAEFVGNPPINILELEGAASNGLGKAMRSYLAERFPALHDIASLGVRPEAVRFTTDASEVREGSFSAPAHVAGILPTGGSWIIEMVTHGHKIFAVTHESPDIAAGADVTLWIKPKALHAFDDKGNRNESADAAFCPPKAR
jgi:iron(III) transport system ATP-binding protein